jgi:hypothetical protein
MKQPDQVAGRRRKLASYEVAGVSKQNKFVPHGTMELSEVSGVPSGLDDLRTIFQPLRSWLISGAPAEQMKAAAGIGSAKLAGKIGRRCCSF